MGEVVLFHGSDCLDGFASGYSAWLALGPEAEYVPVEYGYKPPPDILDGATVYILDFSYPRDTLLELAKRCTVQVLDHHETAKEDLYGLPFATFDLTKSGAVLAWEHFHPNKPIPPLLAHIQDRDLWQWKLPGTKEITTALRYLPRTFVAWCGASVSQLEEQGEVLVKMMDEQVATVAKMIRLLPCAGLWAGLTCAYVSTPILVSEVAHRILADHPEADFVAVKIENHRDQVITWSLRSRPGGPHVGEIAKLQGGGGHANASGWQERMDNGLRGIDYDQAKTSAGGVVHVTK